MSMARIIKGKFIQSKKKNQILWEKKHLSARMLERTPSIGNIHSILVNV